METATAFAAAFDELSAMGRMIAEKRPGNSPVSAAKLTNQQKSA